MLRKVFIILTLFLCVRASADPGEIFFRQQFDNRNGLSNSAINYIFKDSDNLLWIATWDGLNMFDGTTFHVFNYSKEDDYKSIGSNVIQHILEDRSGNIWISTIEGISRYEKSSGKFYNYFYDRGQRRKISEREYAIAVDSAGKVYCYNQKNGLSYFDAQADTFREVFLPKNKGRVNKLAFDARNQLWLLSSNGELDVCTAKQNRFVLAHTFREKSPVVNFFMVNGKVFYQTDDKGLYGVSNASFISKKETVTPHVATGMIWYKDHYLLAWSTKGYGVYDPYFKSSDFLASQAGQLQNIKLTSWALGSEDILWYGTDGNGIIRIYPRTKPFGTVSTSDNSALYNRAVRAFTGESGNLWVGTKGSGIMLINNFWNDANARQRKQYLTAPAQLDNNSVYALKKGNDGLIYIGSDGSGLTVYDAEKKHFYKWADIKKNVPTPDFGSVYVILQDADSSLWLGTSGYGLVHVKIEKSTKGLSLRFIERFTFTNNNTGPANDIIYSLAAAGDGQLWIGCRYGGLNLFDKKTKKFRTFKAFTYDGSLSNNDVLAVYKDSRNRVWVGTSYGLNWINSKDVSTDAPVFKKLTVANGLPNNTIHAIEEDRAGNIWVSTNKGLARIDQADLKISYYQQSDGLQSNEFSDGAVWKDKLDNIYFGGTYGFNHFLPQNITKTTWLPKLLLSGISFGGEMNENGFFVFDVAGKQPLNYTISRKNNFFELDVKAISFLNAEKCNYSYFLEGYDGAWHAANGGKIVYSNLMPGDYTLRIKWSNGEGIWTSDQAIIHLKVDQYFWLTGYAFLVYALLIAALAYLFYRYKKNKQKIKHQLILEQMLRAKEDEIHTNRLGFFTNIAHELQTPLTLVMGSAEKMLEESKGHATAKEKSHFLSLIHQQASRLTYLVHQLLEFRKVESGFFNNEYVYVNIGELLYNLAEPFIALSEQGEMKYDIDIDPEICGWLDKDKTEKIIFNLLSNAFKHSEKNEQVKIKAVSNAQGDQLEISVSNSGVQLPPQQLHRLFDQFYSGASQQLNGGKYFGTGIGLAFTRQLVHSLQGQITVHNQDGWITFSVQLPLRTGYSAPGEGASDRSDQPSYLYKTITAHMDAGHNTPSVEVNKDAVIEQLLEKNKKTILVVEDEAEIRFLFREILGDEYIIYEAENGVHAIELINSMMPDLVVSDVMMPRMDGLELCHKLKNTPAFCHIPFIILSARGSEDHHMQGYEAGADAYIAKPFHTTHLQLRIRKLLEGRQKLHEHFNSETSTNEMPGTGDIPESDREFLNKVVSLVNEHLCEPELNAAFLEKAFCMSKMQLYRKLKTLTGMTTGEFIRNLRLKNAAHLLLTTNLSVTEIYYRTGFNNQSYFFREFKKRFKYAPNEYRDMQGIRE